MKDWREGEKLKAAYPSEREWNTRLSIMRTLRSAIQRGKNLLLSYNQLATVDDVDTRAEPLSRSGSAAHELTADTIDVERLSAVGSHDGIEAVDDTGDGQSTVGELEEVVGSLTAREDDRILAGR